MGGGRPFCLPSGTGDFGWQATRKRNGPVAQFFSATRQGSPKNLREPLGPKRSGVFVSADAGPANVSTVAPVAVANTAIWAMLLAGRV